jgi:uracil phosphoribosyltransferase
MPVHVLNHPLGLHKLSILRDRKTKPVQFRQLIDEITLLLACRATSSLDLVETKPIETPLGSTQGLKLKDKVGLFPIMRAGNGMVHSMLTVLPMARVHHLGLYREKSTLLPVEYYNKLPADCSLDIGFVIDPMIATAGTAIGKNISR